MKDEELAVQLCLSVWEESNLTYVGAQVTEPRDDGRVTVGPWDRQECSIALMKWFELGWLDLIAHADDPLRDELGPPAGWEERARREGRFLTLASADAREILTNVSLWEFGTKEANVMLCRSDQGDDHEPAEWIAALT